jgi:hypothetical protein
MTARSLGGQLQRHVISIQYDGVEESRKKRSNQLKELDSSPKM